MMTYIDPRALRGKGDFEARCKRLGYILSEYVYVDSSKAYPAVCPNGHKTNLRPTHVQQNRGLCSLCAGNDAGSTEARFLAQVIEQGGSVKLPWIYKGASKPHHVLCGQGHNCFPRPNDVKKGHGICKLAPERHGTHITSCRVLPA